MLLMIVMVIMIVSSALMLALFSSAVERGVLATNYAGPGFD